ncbi:hypothetical protein RKT29_004233 [Salmonella enterica subsp. enterica serovar Lome]|nr:hypothetical protein [Salmonella enterica subsp. enterica]EEK5733401.1 hypothetical protein [Salmonella enterica]EHC7797945.1 hypothetical protein [Salmonella enterica subsp. enterica serovar Isangi]ELD7744697.1 hypothetical protein [Salmonella enterica subsp. enterica serovar Lome]EHD2000927.1 hypothetical protein [Salmonella enterica subsp. enterica serovar Isangi]
MKHYAAALVAALLLVVILMHFAGAVLHTLAETLLAAGVAAVVVAVWRMRHR